MNVVTVRKGFTEASQRDIFDAFAHTAVDRVLSGVEADEVTDRLLDSEVQLSACLAAVALRGCDDILAPPTRAMKLDPVRMERYGFETDLHGRIHGLTRTLTRNALSVIRIAGSDMYAQPLTISANVDPTAPVISLQSAVDMAISKTSMDHDDMWPAKTRTSGATFSLEQLARATELFAAVPEHRLEIAVRSFRDGFKAKIGKRALHLNGAVTTHITRVS